MTVSLTTDIRESVKAIAAVALPGFNQQPKSTNIDIGDSALDSVLSARPDLHVPFIQLLTGFEGDAETFLQSLSDSHFTVLMTVLCATYLQNSDVQQALNYPGQQALTLDRGGFGGEELVLQMMELPKRFRPV